MSTARHIRKDTDQWRLSLEGGPPGFLRISLREATEEVERLREALASAARGLELCSIGGRWDPADVIGVYDEIRECLGDEYPPETLEAQR